MYEVKRISLSFVQACIIQVAVSETYDSPWSNCKNGIALSYRLSSLGNVPLLYRLNLDQITFDMILRVLAQQGHL